MEYLVFFIAVGALLLFLFVREYIQTRQREKVFIRELYEDYGKLKNREYSPERFLRISGYYERHQKPGQLDDITWNDLDMDDIFKRMNHTLSATGEEYLYYTLRNINKNNKELAHFEEMVSYFMDHPDERVKVQLLMRKLGYTGKYSLYDYMEQLDLLGKRSNRRQILVDLLLVPLILLAPFELSVALGGIAIWLCFNISTYFKEKKEIEPFIISFVYVIRLLDVSKELIKTQIPVCEKELEEMKEYVDKLKGVRKGLLKDNYSMTGNPLDILVDYFRMSTHIDIIQFNRMLFAFRQHTQDVDALIERVGWLESTIATGAFRASLENGWCVPKLSEQTQDGLFLENGYHPSLSRPVKNTIDAKRGVLLTGSNASGKSTFLKMVALNAILAQTVHTCAADAYEAPLFTIYSSMSLRDNMEKGESYYIAEIRAIKRILEAAGGERKVLCFVDEVLRGTNTVERIAAAVQILRSMNGKDFLCFAATHDIELTELLKDCYSNYHFEEEIVNDDILFQYRLLSGKATTRNAIRLLQIMGYDETIIEKATDMAERFVQTGIWREG